VLCDDASRRSNRFLGGEPFEQLLGRLVTLRFSRIAGEDLWAGNAQPVYRSDDVGSGGRTTHANQPRW